MKMATAVDESDIAARDFGDRLKYVSATGSSANFCSTELSTLTTDSTAFAGRLSDIASAYEKGKDVNAKVSKAVF